MAIESCNSYSSYSAQLSNNSTINTDKAIISNENTTDKTNLKDEYFKNLSNKYSNINLNMSDSHLNIDNKLIFNVSPKLIRKAISDTKVAKKLEGLLDQIPSLKQYISSHKHSLSGSEVKNVSVVIDENGGCSCKIEFEQENPKNTRETSDEENLRRKKIKEQIESDFKLNKEQRIYKNISKNIHINLLDRSV